MKKLVALLLTLMLACSALGGVGCKAPAGSNNPEDLEIYCYIAGYGSSWLEGTIELFKQQDWVKEKYPNLTITLDTDSIATQAGNRLANQKQQTTDLYFAAYREDKMDPAYLTNLTELVYCTEIPGQPGTLIMDRVHPLAKRALREDGYGTTKYNGVDYDNYYGMKYVSQWYGYMYNKDLFDQCAAERGWVLPVTTDEMFAICEDIKTNGYTYILEGKTEKTYEPIMITGANGGYVQNQFRVYWSQYEGITEYENFFEAYDSNTESISTDGVVLKQKGRLRALEVMDYTLQNYGYSDALETEYLDGQGLFLSGTGMFHWNGDYFTTEMKNFRDAMRGRGTDYEIQTMAMPVLSSLVEKLSFYIDNHKIATPEYNYSTFTGNAQVARYQDLDAATKKIYDTVLSSVIREIDAGKTWADCTKTYSVGGTEITITEEDFEIINNARMIKGSRTLSQQAAVIPANTPAKALAADFLRFFYTDVAIENYGKASKGLTFPVTYFENLSDEEYAQATQGFEPEAKTKYDIFYGFCDDYATGTEYIPANTQFAAGKAGLEELISYEGDMDQDFLSQEQSKRYTPKKIFEGDITYWEGGFWDALVNQIS